MSTITAPETSSHRILIVDGTELVRVGLVQVISAASCFKVCAAIGDYAEVAPLLERHRPHLLIAEPFHGARDGLMWIKDIAARFPETKILIVSSQAEATYAERALRIGVAGYWMKSGTTESLLEAVSTVLSGELYVSRRIASLAARKLVKGSVETSEGVSALSDRELHVFALIGAGHGVGRIAQELGISRKTVETHCEHIKVKLNYSDATALKQGARELLASPNGSQYNMM
jgi:DNA-binding NarL/FixJ family response regulator